MPPGCATRREPPFLPNHQIVGKWPKKIFWRSPELAPPRLWPGSILSHLHPTCTSHSSSPSLGCFFWWKPTSISLSHTRHPVRWDQHSDGNQAEDFQSCTQRGYKREPTAIDLGREEETSAKSQWKSRQMHTPGSRAAAQLVNVTGVRNPLPTGRHPAGASQQCWACWPLPTDCPWHGYQEQTLPLGSPWTSMSQPGKTLAWHSFVPGFAPSLLQFCSLPSTHWDLP